MDRLREGVSELLDLLERHKPNTMSQKSFREKVRALANMWEKVRIPMGCCKEVEDLDVLVDKLLALTRKVSPTRDYKETLLMVDRGLARLVRRQPENELLSSVSSLLHVHPRILEVSGTLFRTGHCSSAVLEAVKAVNQAVKAKSGRFDLDGTDMMSKVFNENEPILKLNGLRDLSDKDEQKGFRFLFMGAVAGIRNPNAHEISRLKDPVRALEMLILSSFLLKLVDESRPVGQ